jgi:ribosomal protein S19
MVITPKMLDCEFEISNGNSMRKVKITSDHVGHRLGEFYESKSRAIFKKNKK